MKRKINIAMKKSMFFLLFSFIFFLKGNAQQSVNAGGGNATGSNGKVSFSIGQVDYESVKGSEGSVSQGIQQPYEFFTVGIDDIPDIQLEFRIYPNPTMDVLYIKNDNVNLKFQYQLFDITGKLILSKDQEVQEDEINMNAYSSGNYMLNIKTKNNLAKSFKIIKN